MGNGKTTNPSDPDVEMRWVVTSMIRLKSIKPKLSGVQKRKRAIQAAIAAVLYQLVSRVEATLNNKKLR